MFVLCFFHGFAMLYLLNREISLLCLLNIQREISSISLKQREIPRNRYARTPIYIYIYTCMYIYIGTVDHLTENSIKRWIPGVGLSIYIYTCIHRCIHMVWILGESQVHSCAQAIGNRQQVYIFHHALNRVYQIGCYVSIILRAY